VRLKISQDSDINDRFGKKEEKKRGNNDRFGKKDENRRPCDGAPRGAPFPFHCWRAVLPP